MAEHVEDKKLKSEFIRIERDDRRIRVLVEEITWPDPHRPASFWTVARSLPVSAPPAEVEDACRAVLEEKRFFAVCRECRSKNPRGLMHGPDLCQACAERNHGIVY